MTQSIRSFRGQYRWLSNFWPAMVQLEGDPLQYVTVEHAYQAAKTFDQKERAYVSRAPTAGEAKRRGREITLREDWDEAKLQVMHGLLRQKFKDPELRSKLLETGDAELVEENSFGDTFWGVCAGQGQNWLGRLLTQVREEVRA